MVLSPSPTQYFNLRQFDALLADEPRRPPRGQYVYYHGLIPHPYYILNERCELVGIRPDASESYWAFARCANLMIERLVDVLDDLGRLDDALIIVHSDHGDMDFLANAGAFGRNVEFALDPVARGYQRPDRTYEDPSMMQTLQDGDSAAWRSIAVEVFSSGLLLVKPPHATGYAHDTRPVQLLDVAPTVVAHFGRSTASYPGLPFSMVPAGREAVFFAHSRRFDGKLSEYRLTPEGWRFRADVRVTP
jgi:arylsulfatase A-like enzyme